MMLEIIRLLLRNFYSFFTAIGLVNETVLPSSMLQLDDKRKVSFYFDLCYNMKSFIWVIRGIKDKLNNSLGETQKNNESQNLYFSSDGKNPYLFKKMLKFSSDKNNFSLFLENIISLNDVIINKIKGLAYWKLCTPMFDLSKASTDKLLTIRSDCPATIFVLILKNAVEFKSFDHFHSFFDEYLDQFIFQNSNPDQEKNPKLKKEFISIRCVSEEISRVEEHLLVKDDGSFDKEKIVKYCKKFKEISLNIVRLFKILWEIETRHAFDGVFPPDKNTHFLSRYLNLLEYLLNSRNSLRNFPDYQPLPDKVEKAFMELGFDESEAETISKLFFSFLGIVKRTNNTFEVEFFENLLGLDDSFPPSLKENHSLNKLTCVAIGRYFKRGATQMNEFIEFIEGLISKEKSVKNENFNKHEEEIKT